MSYHHGQVIRVYRQRCGMSQAELAERWPKADGTEGVNTRYVQDVEYGKKRISNPAILRGLASLLHIPLQHMGLSEYDPFASPLLLSDLEMAEHGESAIKDPPANLQAMPAAPSIPSPYYERMLDAYAHLEPVLFSWTMWNLGLFQLSSHFVSHSSPINIAVFKCSPPNPRVRSLHTLVQQNQYLPQTVNLRFAGNESFAGQALQAGQPLLLDAQRYAVPITRRKRIGACLVVQAQAAIDAPALNIVRQYADIFALAFSDTEFYLPQDIDLCTIPPDLKQDVLLQEFDLQNLDLVALTLTNPARIQQAEELILQHILTPRRGEIHVPTR